MSADSWFQQEAGGETSAYRDSRDFPIPIQLWNAGYDVWLANNRGVSHSQGHAHLDAEQHPDLYWDFSFAEIGLYDIPAMVKTVKRTLKEDHFFDEYFFNIDKIAYLGYD